MQTPALDFHGNGNGHDGFGAGPDIDKCVFLPGFALGLVDMAAPKISDNLAIDH
jgi:hypothetical protein